MNKAGRLPDRSNEEAGEAPEAVISAGFHARILAAASDDVSCLFVHLRDHPAFVAGNDATAPVPPRGGAVDAAD
jgi:hypothetical protein